MNNPNKERNAKIVELREKGLTFKQISEEIGLTPGGVSNIYYNQLSKKKLLEKEPHRLSFYGYLLMASDKLDVNHRYAMIAYNALVRNHLIHEVEHDMSYLISLSDDRLRKIKFIGELGVKLIRLADDIRIGIIDIE